MNSPEPILIGYFAHRPWIQAEDRRSFPPHIDGSCNLAKGIAPTDWINLWLHNDFWVYSTEARAWAAVDNANLHGFRDEHIKHRVTSRAALRRSIVIACWAG